MAPDHVKLQRTLISVALLALVILTSGCSRRQPPPTQPAPTFTPTIQTIDPEATEDAFAAQFRETIDLFGSASTAFNGIRSQVRRDPNLINDPAWRASVQNVLLLIQRGVDNNTATPTHPTYTAATDAMYTAALTYATAAQQILSALEQSNVEALISAEDSLDQADDQRRVASSFFFAER